MDIETKLSSVIYINKAKQDSTDYKVNTEKDCSHSPKAEGKPDKKSDIAESREKTSDDLIEKAISSANKVIIPSNRKLEYKIHDKTHQVMVKVIDTGTNEIIREIPPEKVLDSYAKMLELAGLIIDTKS